jgi:hypothetical protein
MLIHHLFKILGCYVVSLLEIVMSLAGYPCNLDFDYGALAQLQHFSINNLGDPFIEGNYGVHSRLFEVGVLDWFARLWEIEKNEYWGYITNCGTEGNLHGVLVGLVTLNFHVVIFTFTSHEILLCPRRVKLKKKKLYFAGGKCSRMGFCTRPMTRIIRFLKQPECIEWSVLRLALWFLVRLIVQILKLSYLKTKTNQPSSMLI